MKVDVIRCITGKFLIRNRRIGLNETIRAEDWTRKQSKEALDILYYLYKVDRKNVRFEHV